MTSKIIAGVMTLVLTAGLLPNISMETAKADTAAELTPRVSVHDPSIFKDSTDGIYYVFGSHTATASSDNLMKWTQLSKDYQHVEEEPFYGNLLENLAEPFAWAGYDDGDCSDGGYAVWAPDIIYNAQYEWDNGDKGAYMIYLCTSSTWRRSCIGYMVSETMDGPYEYVDTLVYSGFTTSGTTDGNSSRNTTWDNEYLNLKSLTDLSSKNGGIDEISEKWFDENGDWDNLYAPNAIDPTVFFDASGEKMYMTYGSWSGGLFLLELDPTTGKAIYPGVDSEDKVSGNYVDRYFGTHLAGGNHQSGEAPYIIYDKTTEYYYLYETYGGLTANGGYNMRLFRSKDVTGPYVDAAGNNAADSGLGNSAYGIKLMGNYSFYDQQGKKSAGHNSALIDDDGSYYLVYHQRFESSPQTEKHEIRVHQQFMNEDGWPVTAVYEYTGDSIASYEEDQIVGSYEFVNHGTNSDGNMLTTQAVDLKEDGSISGDVTGTWSKQKSADGDYDDITLNIEGITYKGVCFLQSNEAKERADVMTFTAIGDNNTSVWGSKMEDSDESRVKTAISSLSSKMPEDVFETMVLPESLMGAEIAWTSSNPEVISEKGEVTLPEEAEDVILTAEITYGAYTETKEYEISVKAKAKLIYGYDFETPAGMDGTIEPVSESLQSEKAVLEGDAKIIKDENRGNVLKLVNEKDAKAVNYLRLPEDTLTTVSDNGYSISLWTNVSEDTWEHSALFEADSSASKPDYPMTRIGVNLIGRINANGYSDVQNELLDSDGLRDQWEQVVYTVSPNGIRVYLNGTLVGEEKKDISSCFQRFSDYSIQKATNVAVGSGFIWGDEDVREAMFDDVLIYDGILSDTEIAYAYQQTAEK